MFFPGTANEEDVTKLFLKQRAVEVDGRYEHMPFGEVKERAREERMVVDDEDGTLLDEKGDVAEMLLARRKRAGYNPNEDEYDEAVLNLCPFNPEASEDGFMALRSKRPAIQALSSGTQAIMQRRTMMKQADELSAAAVEGSDPAMQPLGFFEDFLGVGVGAAVGGAESSTEQGPLLPSGLPLAGLTPLFPSQIPDSDVPPARAEVGAVGAPAREEKLGFQSGSSGVGRL